MTQRLSTGLADLDQILGGGLRPASMVLMAGL
jgi:predicted ATP-dependent serine protease